MENNQPITQNQLIETLGTFTEETLLPAVSTMIDEKLEKGFKNFGLEMDDKLADLKGDLIILMRKEDRKLGALIELLANKQVISPDDVKQILSLEPFPKT